VTHFFQSIKGFSNVIKTSFVAEEKEGDFQRKSGDANFWIRQTGGPRRFDTKFLAVTAAGAAAAVVNAAAAKGEGRTA